MSLGRPPRAKDHLKSRSFESDGDPNSRARRDGQTTADVNNGNKRSSNDKADADNGNRSVDGQGYVKYKEIHEDMGGTLNNNDIEDRSVLHGSSSFSDNGGLDDGYYDNNSSTQNDFGRVPDESGTSYPSESSRGPLDYDISRRNVQQPANPDDPVYATNGYGVEILEVIQEDTASHPEIRSDVNSDKASKRGGVEMARNASLENEDELTRQRRALDFGFYEPPSDPEGDEVFKGKHPDDEAGPENSGLSNAELSDDKKSDSWSKKIHFKLGGEEDTESDIGSRRSSYEDKPVDTVDGRAQGQSKPIRDYRVGNEQEISSSLSPDRYRRRDDEPTSADAARGLFSSPRRRHVSDNSGGDGSKSNINDLGINNRRRVSIDDQGPVVLGENNGKLMKSGSNSSFNSAYGGTGGILKKSPTPVHQGFANPDRPIELEPPGAAMSEGLRKYRRRSQLMVSSDIPTDVPLKHRQLENEQRNKNNLEFIKRRVSLTELQPKPNEGPRRNISSFEYASELNNEPNKMRREGESHQGLPLDNRYYGRQESDPSSQKGNGLARSGTDVSLDSNETQEGRERRRINSTGSTENVPKYTDEDIDDYLGNIPAHQRRFCLPPSPQNLVPPGGAPRFFDNGTAIQGPDGNNGSVGYNNEAGHGISNPGFEGDEESAMQPYIPMKRQRIHYEDSEPMKTHDAQRPLADRETLQTLQPPRYSARGSISSLASQTSDSASSLGDQRLPSHIRKDSIALFNSKLYEGGGGRLRRLSQVSLAELEQLKRKHHWTQKDSVTGFTALAVIINLF